MLIMYTLILIATVMDVKTGRISNRLILTGWILGFLRMCVCYGIGGFKAWLFQISFPIIVLYLLFLVGALGAGDIKLFSLISGFMNIRETLVCMMASFVIGAVISAIHLMLRGDFINGIRRGCRYLLGLWEWSRRGADMKYPVKYLHRMPFSIAILGGALMTLFL